MSQYSKVLDYYRRLLEDSQVDFERVGWGSLESQEKRFLILSEIGIQSGHSVLDVGCGAGNLYEWFLKHKIDVSYLGLDINENMIRELNRTKKTIKFECRDILSLECERERYDFVVMSGAITIPVNNQDQFVIKILNRMFSLSKIGVAVNFMSTSADVIKPEMYYANPANICALITSITRKYVLRHDYMTHDFTVYMYR